MPEASTPTPLRWTDNHCHLGWAEDDADAGSALEAARAAGVHRMISVGTDAERSAQAAALAAEHQGTVWATVGLHPHEARHGLAGIRTLLDKLDLTDPATGVVAIGECGLDYYYDHSPRDVQRAAFAEQIALAHDLDLALVIHTRDAWEDTFDVLDAEGVPERTVLHCFTGGPDEARACLDRGMFISFSGIVTFRNATEVQEAAALCPPDRLLVETDSPYLAPVPHRGRRNQPAWLPHVGEKLAELTGLSRGAVAERTGDNATEVYRLTTGSGPETSAPDARAPHARTVPGTPGGAEGTSPR